MSARLRHLQSQKTATVAAMRSITEAAAAEDRDLSPEEQSAFDLHKTKIQTLNASIEREQLLAVEEAGLSAALPAGHTSAAVAVAAHSTISVEDNTEKDPRRGFASFGEYARAVMGASVSVRSGSAVDHRLMPLASAPSSFGGETFGADGGVLVPPGFSGEIFRLSLGEDALLPMTDDMQIDGNNMTVPKDETTPWGTNGIRAYWQGEATSGTPTKPALGAMSLRLKKLLALVPVSDELLSDTSALSSYLPAKVADSIRWKTNEAILFGAGGGVPLGALVGGAAVTVAKDAGQSANTLSASNLANMIARLPPGSFSRAVWLINNDVLPALFTLTLGSYPIYLPAGSAVGGIVSSPYGMLLGRPVMVSQHAKSFSSEGDVLLVDLSYYQAITKAEGVVTASSMHLYFDADAMAFRTTFRMDGQPKITTAISPANGSTALSPFVKLGAR
jgi:HK97 family phage major capsid protein